MTEARLLVIQPDPSDPPAALGEWFREAGAELSVVRLPADPLPASLDDFDGLVCLGGEMGAQDDDRHPWLADLRRLLSSAVTGGVPTLGVCLGAQLLAVAVGGQVTRGDDGPEAGGSLVSKKDAAWNDPLFAELPLVQDVLQFHQDVIARLPSSAELLAGAPRYPNQAYRIGSVAYGLQFHIETTPEIVRQWAAEAPEVAEVAKEGAFESGTLARLHDDLAETWRPFAHRFVRLVAGELVPAAGQGRGLPLA